MIYFPTHPNHPPPNILPTSIDRFQSFQLCNSPPIADRCLREAMEQFVAADADPTSPASSPSSIPPPAHLSAALASDSDLDSYRNSDLDSDLDSDLSSDADLPPRSPPLSSDLTSDLSPDLSTDLSSSDHLQSPPISPAPIFSPR